VLACANRRMWWRLIGQPSRRLKLLRSAGQARSSVAPTGLRSTQYTLLTQIEKSGQPSLQELAGVLVMDLSALGHTLKSLIRDGLVVIKPDLNDRRVKRATLTSASLAKQVEAQQLWNAAQRRCDAFFGETAAREMRRMLNAISSPEFAARFHADVNT
jgi:DNA-binding MarR family transcriptional regulator